MSAQTLAVKAQYLDIRDLAECLGISTATIYRMRSLGEDLPRAFKVGSQLRWRQETVDQWVAAREEAADD